VSRVSARTKEDQGRPYELNRSQMMFAYNFDDLNAFLKGVLRKNLAPPAWTWLENEGVAVREKGDTVKFNIAFVAMPRRTAKDAIALSAEEQDQLRKLRSDFSITGWTAERLGRTWLLLQLQPRDKEKYIQVIENLFLAGEMSELVALYGSLPLLAYPESWRKRCAEGIRSNIGQVLEAVICRNPYPLEQLDEAAWNQLVLKALFTDKPILEIAGLRQRVNHNLARALSDYAHERWAAHRPVNPLLWICVSPFINEGNFSDIQRIFTSKDPLEREAAALVCSESLYLPAKRLLEQNGLLKTGIEKGNITWDSIAKKSENRP
jgi:hypothetical protein